MGAAAVGAIILVGFLASLAFQFDVALKGGIKLEETGQVGDFIGGIVGSFWALAGVLLFYSALNLQRQEFDLQRRELKSQRQEIAVTRITDTIYRQLEIVDSAERKLSLNFDPRASRQVTLDGKELLDAIVNGTAEKSDTHRANFETFAKSSSALAHVIAILRTLEICSSLIDQRKLNEDQLTGESLLHLDDTSRQLLYKVVSANLDAYKLEAYFTKLESVHMELWVKAGSPGRGRFHLDQIQKGRKLLVRSTSPGQGIIKE